MPEIVSWLSQHQDNTVLKAIDNIGLNMLSKEELV
jgi:hypothetical protein